MYIFLEKSSVVVVSPFPSDILSYDVVSSARPKFRAIIVQLENWGQAMGVLTHEAK
jgi:hypothetical protein